jgi:hypothetical protein
MDAAGPVMDIVGWANRNLAGKKDHLRAASYNKRYTFQIVIPKFNAQYLTFIQP